MELIAPPQTKTAVAETLFSIPSLRVVAVEDGVAVVRGSDTDDLAKGGDLGPVLLGHRQVVQVERVLRAEVAPDVALAAIAAPLLGHAELVGVLAPVGVGEVYGEIRIVKLLRAPESLDGVRHPPGLRG